MERKRRIRHDYSSNTSRPAPIKGTRQNFSLPVAKKMAWLFLSGLDPDVTGNQVKEFVESNVEDTEVIVRR